MTTLLLSPHVDDEVLGAFSFLGADTHVVYCGVEDRPGTPASTRLRELESVARHLGFTWTLLDNVVNSYEVQRLISPIEERITAIRPSLLLLPAWNSYNQDHRTVFEAGTIASRLHDKIPWVTDVMVFEQPDVFLNPLSPVDFNVFRQVDIEAKLHAYQLYASQVRGHRSPELIRALAHIRGQQARLPFAEAFAVRRLRWRDAMV